jgi:hypothetical protein
MVDIEPNPTGCGTVRIVMRPTDSPPQQFQGNVIQTIEV